ncbi:MAG TPA: DUF177 domain-containing protein [Egibacteraceae bacterium]|nr:DUF177 domain-containing protein [Egibacteraceae bacterium]
MTAPRTDHVLNVVDLVDRPGASRRVDLAIPVPEGLESPAATVHEPVRLSGVVESVVEGILLRGTVRARATVACSRCLADLSDELSVDVSELFIDPEAAPAEDPVEPGYELIGDRLDLDMLLRDALVPAVPYRLLCRPECAGLCVSCGANLNEGACGCEETLSDSRWKVLEGLELPEGD